MKQTSLLICIMAAYATPLLADSSVQLKSVKVMSEELETLRQSTTLEAIENTDVVVDESTPVSTTPGMQPLCNDKPCDTRRMHVHERVRMVEQRMNTDADGDGFTITAGDCDDSDGLTYPTALELNDGIDNNCDGIIDNALPQN